MIIVSGDHLAPEFDEPAAMRNYLITAGLPAQNLIVDAGGFDTYESCLRAKRIFNLSQLIIVTQSYHLIRAVATCRALGIDASGVGDDSARQHTIAWWRGAIRDQLACVKTVVDLATTRSKVWRTKYRRRAHFAVTRSITRSVGCSRCTQRACHAQRKEP